MAKFGHTISQIEDHMSLLLSKIKEPMDLFLKQTKGLAKVEGRKLHHPIF
jgi:hypothetical protein